jgi:carbon monoxide dehydrogenase subunit G
MRIENVVEVDAPVDRVWALVNDIPRVAPCMPGAALTGVVDDQTYQGTVAVKLGPLRMSYKGTVVVEEVDQASHSARLAASGKDTKGAGTARATVQTRLEPIGSDRTRMSVASDVQLTGRVASFGRGGAINDVATRLFGEFADCLRTTLEAVEAPAAAAAGTAPAAATDEGAPTPTAPAVDTPAATVTPGAAPIHTTPAPAPPARAVKPLDAGSLAGTVVRGRVRAFFQAIAAFFRRLFGGRSRA